MRIIKATDAIQVEHPVLLLFAQPGWGKSSLGYSCADPLTLDFDKGAHRAANRRDTMVIDSWADVADMGEAIDPYRTIVIDTVGRCLDVMTADIIRETPKLGPNGNLSQQGWGVLKNRFRTWMATLRTSGKDVLLIAHDKEDKDGDTRIVRPDIVGGSYNEVMKVADVVGYGYIAGRKRVLDFNPTDRWIGKNPGGWEPFEVPPVAKAQSFMADIFDRSREALGRLSEESAQITQQVNVWREKFAGLHTAGELNEQMPLVKAIAVAVVQPQVAKLLMDRGKELEIPFDAKAKRFTVPDRKDEKQPAAVAS